MKIGVAASSKKPIPRRYVRRASATLWRREEKIATRQDVKSGGRRGALFGDVHRELSGLRGKSAERSAETRLTSTGAGRYMSK